MAVADEDRAVLIPAGLFQDVVAAGPEQEQFEAWTRGEVEQGIVLPRLYPASADTKACYEAAKRQRRVRR
jgi:hypothetical protein